jgi:peptidoglycan/xylan/chitin deacetylase (PgdA/CDA1 family)
MKAIHYIKVFLLSTVLFLGSAKISFAEFAPPARLTFTIDDGSKNIYEKAAPIFSAHNFPAVVYGETLQLNSGEDWVMSWDQLKDLRDRLGWEIGSHTINHYDLTTVTADQLESELRDSKADFAKHGIDTKSFSSPFGTYNNTVIKAAGKYYNSHRAAWGGPNVWPSLYDDYELWSLEVKHTTTPEEVMGWIDEAVANNQWLVLLLHDVIDGVPVEYEYNKDDLKKIVDYAASKPIKVVTTSQGLELGSGDNLVKNGSFETVNGVFAANWTRNMTNGITVNTANNGNFPNPKNSLKIVGAAKQREAISAYINVDSAKSYILKMFVNTINYTSGAWAVWINEYDANNKDLEGQWFEGGDTAKVGVKYFNYTPSSNQVKKIKIHIYTEPNSKLTMFVDSVQLKSIGDNPNPTPTSIPTIEPTLTPTGEPTATPTETPIPTITPTLTPTPIEGTNLLENGSFEIVDATGFAAGWTRENINNISIDTNNNGYLPQPKNSLKISAGTSQYTTISPKITLSDASAKYELSYFLKTDNFTSGGTAAYIEEYDTSGNWLGGQWLGGRYTNTTDIIKFTFTPKTGTKSIQIHLFTEDSSSMIAYFDEVKLIKL